MPLADLEAALASTPGGTPLAGLPQGVPLVSSMAGPDLPGLPLGGPSVHGELAGLGEMGEGLEGPLVVQADPELCIRRLMELMYHERRRPQVRRSREGAPLAATGLV